MKILLLGGSGRLGTALRSTFAAHDVEAPSRAELDLDRLDRIADAIAARAPDVIVNCAAWTDVDGAERETAAAFRLNADAPGEIGAAAARCGARVVHLSTNYVFDGMVADALDEDAPAQPLNAYGRSKLAGERRLASSGAAYAILRVGWLYDGRPGGVVDAVVRRARAGEPLQALRQRGSPTASIDVARRMNDLLDTAGSIGAQGVFHLAPPDHAWRRDWLAAICERAGVVPTIVDAASSGAAATRPMHVVLDAIRFRRTFGAGLRPWRDALDEVMGIRVA